MSDCPFLVDTFKIKPLQYYNWSNMHMPSMKGNHKHKE